MKGKKSSLWANIILAIFSFVIIFPIFTIVIWIFTERWAWPDLIPQVFSLRAVSSVFHKKEELLKVTLSSIEISLAVGVISVTAGAMAARALECYEFPGKKFFSALSMMPFLVPASVFAMGIQMTFIKIGLSSTAFGVILAHLICSLPYAVRLMQEGTRAFGLQLEEQARVLGAGPFKAFFAVSLPNLAPVMLSAFSMAYVVSFSQYFLTLIIGGGSVKTYAIVMVPYLTSGERNFASIYSAMFLMITIIIFGTIEWLVNKWTKEQEVEYYAS